MKLKTFAERHGLSIDDLKKRCGIVWDELGADCWIAGGTIRDWCSGTELTSDVDIFFRTADKFESLKELLTKSDAYKPMIQTDTHHKYKGNDGIEIDLINFDTYQDMTECLDSFDITVSQFATDGLDLALGLWSLWDLGRRRIAIHKVSYATATMARIMRYQSKGFKPCYGTYATVLEAVVQDPSIINSNIKYID